MASILLILFFMAAILALVSLILPARYYEARGKSKKRSFLIWLCLALFLFVGIALFTPPEEPPPGITQETLTE